MFICKNNFTQRIHTWIENYYMFTDSWLCLLDIIIIKHRQVWTILSVLVGVDVDERQVINLCSK